jgi:carbon-monoxide dehydrogenase medium subunit
MTLLADFEIIRPPTLQEALKILNDHGDKAAVYVGGTELIPLMKLRLIRPAVLVDFKGVAALKELDFGSEHTWTVGAAMSHRSIAEDGTIGGNLCFADPHSNPSTLLMALGASVHLASHGGSRSLPLTSFIQGAFQTALRPGEVLVRILIPAIEANQRVRVERIVFRERPTVVVAFVDRPGDPTVVVGAVGEHPKRLAGVEALLSEGCDDGTVLAARAMEDVDPLEDLDGSIEFKRHLAGIAVRRVITGR